MRRRKMRQVKKKNDKSVETGYYNGCFEMNIICKLSMPGVSGKKARVGKEPSRRHGTRRVSDTPEC